MLHADCGKTISGTQRSQPVSRTRDDLSEVQYVKSLPGAQRFDSLRLKLKSARVRMRDQGRWLDEMKQTFESAKVRVLRARDSR